MKTAKTKVKLAGLLMLVLVCFGCKPEKEQVYSVQMLSYGNYSETQLLRLQQEVQNCFDTLIPEITVSVEVLGNRPIPEMCWNASHQRLRADSILRYQRRLDIDKEVYILGVTSKDISSSVHGIDDWGILGLSNCPGYSAVVSTYRVKDKALFYKVAVHELLHCFGLPHCSQKDRSCYICAADKHPRLEKQTRLCDACRKKLQGPKAFK